MGFHMHALWCLLLTLSFLSSVVKCFFGNATIDLFVLQTNRIECKNGMLDRIEIDTAYNLAYDACYKHRHNVLPATAHCPTNRRIWPTWILAYMFLVLDLERTVDQFLNTLWGYDNIVWMYLWC